MGHCQSCTLNGLWWTPSASWCRSVVVSLENHKLREDSPQESRICKERCFHLSTKWLLEIPFVQLIYQVDMQYASCSRGSRKSPSWIRLDGPSMTPTWGNVVTGHLAEPGVLRCVPLAWHGLHLAFEKQNKKPTTQVASFQIPVRMSFFSFPDA